MHLTFFALLAVVLLASAPAPSEQQMMIRRHSGTIDLSKHQALSRRLFPDYKNSFQGQQQQQGQQKSQQQEEDCSEETNHGSQAKFGEGQTQPVEKQPKQEKPLENPPAYTPPPAKQEPPSKQSGNVNVPATLQFGKTFHGDATYYGSAGGGGACGFGHFQATLPGIAIGAHIFGQGEACGACVKIDPGSHGKPVIVQVDNKCPECGDGIDSSKEAWGNMTSENPTRFPVTWQFVPCGIKEPIEIDWISKGNLFDLRFDFRKVSGAVTKAEVSLGNDEWVSIHHQDTVSYVPTQQGEDHAVLQQKSFTIRLTNAKGEQVSCPNLNAALWQGTGAKDGWLPCPDSSFQFTTS